MKIIFCRLKLKISKKKIVCVFSYFLKSKNLKTPKTPKIGGDVFKNAFEKNKFWKIKKNYNSEKYFLKIQKSKVSPSKILIL